METVLVVNGERYWQEYLTEYKVEQKKVQSSEWLIKEGELYVVDEESVCKPNKILWRLGAIKPTPKHKTILEMIRFSGIPCVNTAESLLMGYDRISMLNVLKTCGLPVIPFNVATSSTQMKNIEMAFPFVVKAGNFHGGYGKVLVENEDKWQDIKDLLFISDDYVSIEPYIKYIRDIRYLAIGDKIWAMARKGKFWKANVGTTDFVLIEPEHDLSEHTKTLQSFLKADIVAIDVLEDNMGNQFFVEYNDIPGLSGFPIEAKHELAKCVTNKVSRN